MDEFHITNTLLKWWEDEQVRKSVCKSCFINIIQYYLLRCICCGLDNWVVTVPYATIIIYKISGNSISTWNKMKSNRMAINE